MRQLGRSRRRWEHNNKMYLKDVRWRAWIGLIRFKNRWLSPMNVVMNRQVPQNAENVLTSWAGPISSSRMTMFHGVRTLVVEKMHPAFYFTSSTFWQQSLPQHKHKKILIWHLYCNCILLSLDALLLCGLRYVWSSSGQSYTTSVGSP